MVPTSRKLFFTAIAVAVAVMAAVSFAMPETAHAGWSWWHKPVREAPEVDPSTLSSAIALAMGGLAVLTDKLRRR